MYLKHVFSVFIFAILLISLYACPAQNEGPAEKGSESTPDKAAEMADQGADAAEEQMGGTEGTGHEGVMDKTAHDAEKAMDDTGHAIKESADKTGHDMKEGAEKTADGMKDAGNAMDKAAHDSMNEGDEAAQDAMKDSADKVDGAMDATQQ